MGDALNKKEVKAGYGLVELYALAVGDDGVVFVVQQIEFGFDPCEIFATQSQGVDIVLDSDGNLFKEAVCFFWGPCFPEESVNSLVSGLRSIFLFLTLV